MPETDPLWQLVEVAAKRVMRAKEDSRMDSDEQDTTAIRDTAGGTLEEPRVLDEIEVEDLAVDGICGVY